ncbi:MAG: cation:proton antiporter [Lachnospiraceae bacterium]|nr:cation:proton antiporter [Lachnospiraceae bacterium]
MLQSITYILFFGLFFGWICKKLHLPALFGMILAGILIGPYVLDLLDPSILNISAQIRKIALVIILIRAGLKLSLADLKKVGRPAILLCFLPASAELIGMLLLAPKLLGISLLEAAVLGSVVAAVSPAVVVPGMIKLMDEGYGTDKGIPQMILAGASVDDVFVIVLFTTFTGMAQHDTVSVMQFVNIPVSLVTGISIGLLAGIGLTVLFDKISQRDMVRVLIVLGCSLLLVSAEDGLSGIVPFASLIAVMCLGMAIRMKKEDLAKRLSQTYDKLWVGAEIFLFVLVGASVQIESAKSAGLKSIVLIFGVLVFRMIGVYLCVLGTNLNAKERLFCMLAYIPKATVQAAIGGVPLAMGLACGNMVLTVSVISILITAPLGAFFIDWTYKKCLKYETIKE